MAGRVAVAAAPGVPGERLADLRRSPLFQCVPADAVLDVSRVVIERQFAPGERLLEQDVEGDTLHLLTCGSVRVLRCY